LVFQFLFTAPVSNSDFFGPTDHAWSNALDNSSTEAKIGVGDFSLSLERLLRKNRVEP